VLNICMSALFFYIVAILTVIAALFVVAARNPVHSVLALIFCFFNAAALFILIGAEYIAMTLVIVYVGAVAVLFLFVVMMLDIRIASRKGFFWRIVPAGLLMSAAIIFNLFFAYYNSIGSFPETIDSKTASQLTNTEKIGMVLYTDYFLAFQLSGLVLLVAMVGAITLTLRHKQVKRQSIYKQLKTNRKEAVHTVSVKSRSGMEGL
jgi:NADH-quinone oxidoreductase subunit J